MLYVHVNGYNDSEIVIIVNNNRDKVHGPLVMSSLDSLTPLPRNLFIITQSVPSIIAALRHLIISE